ncbi:hypothetical protein [Sphingobacterium mizutaii]|uniref:hypothetical protein n=1 Tax=Sphingobacterium mizutaii TaxID=1010 RepID=UPI0016285953|nr:hypothetical protein [Sphingobacterium mizutaii]
MTKKRKKGAGKYSNVILNQLIDLVCFIPRCFVPQHDKKRKEGSGKYSNVILK